MNGDEESYEEEMERHEGRLALALGMDRGAKVFNFSLPSPQEQPKPKEAIMGAGAKGDPVWGIDYGTLSPAEASPRRFHKDHKRSVSATPFRYVTWLIFVVTC